MAGAALTLGILFITGALNSGTTVHSPFVAGTAVPVVADPPNISQLATVASQSLVTVAVTQAGGDMVKIATGISVAKDRVLTTARPLLGATAATLVVVTPGSKADGAPRSSGSTPRPTWRSCGSTAPTYPSRARGSPRGAARR